MTYEIPARSEKDWSVVGLSRKENKRFWQIENKVNHYWYRGINFTLLVGCFIFSVQFFMVSFHQVDWTTYVLFQVVNISHFCFFLFRFLHIVYTVNLMLVAVIRFLSKKFNYIRKKIVALGRSRKEVNNRKLFRLLRDYNFVHVELEEMNCFFRQYVGYNTVHFFILGILSSFSCLFGDLRMAVAIMMIIVAMYVCIIYFPFQQANRVPVEVRFKNHHPFAICK